MPVLGPMPATVPDPASTGSSPVRPGPPQLPRWLGPVDSGSVNVNPREPEPDSGSPGTPRAESSIVGAASTPLRKASPSHGAAGTSSPRWGKATYSTTRPASTR